MSCCIALGFFDGVHLGHQVLLKQAKEIALVKKLPFFALTFCGLEEVKKVPLINTYDDRRELILNLCQPDEVKPLLFDQELRSMSAQAFFYQILLHRYRAAHLVVGENFTFGSDRQDIDCLKALTEQAGCCLTVVPLMDMENVSVSSSRIRKLLLAGQIGEANRLLGHPHIISGIVSNGRQIGRTLGFPTLNLPYPDKLITLPRGVYLTKTRLSDGRELASISNLGIHPTFESALTPILETHLLSPVGELYGQEIQVSFFSFLRKEQSFPCIEELKKQLDTDIQSAKNFFSKCI